MMKYLKKIFEDIETEDKLLYYINTYDDLLKKDKIWKNYYILNDINNFKYNYNDINLEKRLKLLNDTIEFAENRVEEIKKDCENDIESIRDIYLNYLEDCESFSDYSIYRNKSELNTFYPYLIELKLVFSEETLKNRKDGQPDGFKITSDEIMDYWKPIYDFFTVLESYEYIPKIKFYQPNGVEMTIIIQKQNEN
jgi:hypothetical protein